MATITESLSEGYVIPDEVLIEILLRLPLLTLQLFRSVSKHWLSLITSEYFTRRLRKPRIDTPCGLFIRKCDSEFYDFVTLGPKVTSFQLHGTVPEA
ncbi:cytosolic glyceraldehyde-3-phosphate dehydrogenase, partial [Tanacetum coccineum]